MTELAQWNNTCRQHWGEST